MSMMNVHVIALSQYTSYSKYIFCSDISIRKFVGDKYSYQSFSVGFFLQILQIYIEIKVIN